jgi:glutamate dehydrogenase (NADP+)
MVVFSVAEGANTSTPEAVTAFLKAKIFCSGCINRYGVATSGLEMSQNSLRLLDSRSR